MSSSDKVAAAKELAQAQARAQQRKIVVMWVVIGVAVAGLFAALVAYMARENAISTVNTGDGQLVSSVASDNGGFGFGATDELGVGLGEAPVRVDVYLDFICPYCAIFEGTQTETLSALRHEGLIEVYYHPLGFLDNASMGTKYSTRSASAAALVAEEAPETWLDFVRLMFANQPAEGTKGLTDAQIQDIARQAGVPDETVAKIPDYAYSDWVTSVSEQASGEGNIHFTPALVVNGVLQDTQNDPNAINWGVEGALEAGLRAAAQEASQ